MLGEKHRGLILVNPGGFVQVVGDQIQVAVIVQIGVGGSVSAARFGKTPGYRFVLKLQARRTPKQVVWHPSVGHLFDGPLQKLRRVGHCLLHRIIRHVLDVIEVVGTTGNAVGNKQISLPIQIIIGQ